MCVLMHTYMYSCLYHKACICISLTYLYMNNIIYTYIGKHGCSVILITYLHIGRGQCVGHGAFAGVRTTFRGSVSLVLPPCGLLS